MKDRWGIYKKTENGKDVYVIARFFSDVPMMYHEVDHVMANGKNEALAIGSELIKTLRKKEAVVEACLREEGHDSV